ncbi:MAG: hypothetical protein AAGA60_28055 [Cyanobacteria bacterium P01_E01_bin.42]
MSRNCDLWPRAIVQVLHDFTANIASSEKAIALSITSRKSDRAHS